MIPDLAATKQATNRALEVVYRHFDCAKRYRNEQAVGEALREALDAGTIAHDDVFVTTKLWNSNHRPERVRPAYEARLLPDPHSLRVRTRRRSGPARRNALRELVAVARIKPAFVQVESHPYLTTSTKPQRISENYQVSPLPTTP